MATPLPPSSDFTGAAITKGDFKAAVSNMRAFLAGLLGTSGEAAAAQPLLGMLFNTSVSKSGGFTVVASDRGKVINCTGTWSMAVTDAATLGNAFCFAVLNSGVGTITIDPYLSQTIDGQSSGTVASGQLKIIYCDGTKLVSIGGGTGLLAVTIYTANGTHTTNTLTRKLLAMAVAGGGAGAGVPAAALNTTVGLGGEAGAVKWAYTASPAGSYSVTIGSGGVGVSAGAGADGGDTVFGALVTAKGGRGNGMVDVSGVSTKSGAGASCLDQGGAGRTNSGAGNAASANTGAGGGGAFTIGGGGAYAGGAGGSGSLMVMEFA